MSRNVSESRGSIDGIYLSGSSNRQWDTVIDYVPEFSDVDIHVRLAPNASPMVRTLAFALSTAEGALSTYDRSFPDAVHVPRPQLFFLDDLGKLAGHLPSPAGSVATLVGQEYRGGERADAYRSPPNSPRHHLYLCHANSPALANHLAIRDYMRANLLAATAYGDLKKRLAREHPNDIDAYVEAKTDFLVGVLREVGFATEALVDIRRMNERP